MTEARNLVGTGKGAHPSPDIETAATWLADNWHVAPQPITRTLREMFGLSFNEAAKAMSEAKRIVGGSK